MRAIIDLLLEVEQLAGNLYRRTAEKYTGDKEFNAFLSRMAEDEDLHYELIKKAEEQLLKKNVYPEAAISIDQDIINQIKSPLSDLYNRIDTEEMSKEAVLIIIANIEFSELNPIFLYVVNTFQGDEKKVQHIAAAMQSHESRIKEFIDRHSDKLDIVNFIRKLPDVWKKKLLVVDDVEPVRMLFSEILEDAGSVETAENGLEALEKVKNSFFDVIVSDISMPVMDGIEFFQKAMEIDSDIKKRFMFCSGNITPDITSFCLEHDLICIQKPVTIPKLRNAVQEVMDRNR